MAMGDILPSYITLENFLDVRSRYQTVLKIVSDKKQPKKPKESATKSLEEIDHWKDEVHRVALSNDSEGKMGGPSLDASTIKEIVNWKLKRGKFRPTILPLVSSNAVRDLEDIVNEALSMPLTEPPSKDIELALKEVSAMIKVLTKLKGIGPATATAILSAVFPNTIPMFSDEAFRWVVMDGAGDAAKGWDRKIAYDMKEYLAYFKKVHAICGRLGDSSHNINSGDVEKVGWVLGNEAILGIGDKKSVASKIQPKDKLEPIKSSKGPDLSQKKETNSKIKDSKESTAIDSRFQDSKELETAAASLSKTTAKRKGTSAEISPPPLRRSKRNREG